MRSPALLSILVFIASCSEKKKPQQFNIAGTYAMEVATPFGITKDTIQVEPQSVQQNLYFVTHKVRFIKKLNNRDTTYRYVVKSHVATYEEHLGHLQDISDGTLFPLYHENGSAAENAAHYIRIK